MAVLIRWIGVAALLLLTTPAAAVFGGRDVPADSPIARALVAVLYKGDAGLGLCTGTVLGPTLVLTAAHCTEGRLADIRIIFSPTLTDVPPDRLRGAAAIARAPTSAESAGTKAFNNPDDLALIALDAAAPEDVAFARITDTPPAGPFTFAGYGATSNLQKPNADGKRQLGFDSTLRSTTLDVAPSDVLLVADQSGGRGVCTGDSGGPLFSSDGGTPIVSAVLIGVSNKRNATDVCRGRAWFAALPRLTPWIVAAAADLGTVLR